MLLWQWFDRLLLPHICVGCGKTGQYLCVHCLDRVSFLAEPIPPPAELPRCPQLLAATVFEPPISNLIHAYKYQGITGLAATAADLMWQAIPFPPADVLTTVPTHPSKVRHRGFNHTELFAQHLAQRLSLPYQPLLVKTKPSQAQASLTDRQARLNPNHFHFATHIPPPDIAGRRILLVDDVITTGSTVAAAAEVLKQLGAIEVTAVALAHGQ